jgi:hypothetical protein
MRDRFRILVLIGVALLAPPAGPAAAYIVAGPPDCTHAIFVANAEYTSQPKLDNPGNDIEAVSAVLRRHGVSTERNWNLSAAELAPDRLLSFFRTKQCGQATLVFYYAGMAVSSAGRLYLVPVDYQADSDNPERGLVAVDEIAKGLAAKADNIFIFVDGSAGNVANPTVAPSSIPALFGGIPQVRLVALSSKPDGFAMDRDPTYGELGPFARMFADAADMDWPDTDAIMLRVRDGVRRVTNGQQLPDWYRATEPSKTPQQAAEPSR